MVASYSVLGLITAAVCDEVVDLQSRLGLVELQFCDNVARLLVIGHSVYYSYYLCPGSKDPSAKKFKI